MNTTTYTSTAAQLTCITALVLVSSAHGRARARQVGGPGTVASLDAGAAPK